MLSGTCFHIKWMLVCGTVVRDINKTRGLVYEFVHGWVLACPDPIQVNQEWAYEEETTGGWPAGLPQSGPDQGWAS